MPWGGELRDIEALMSVRERYSSLDTIAEHTAPIVFVVDDDISMREALEILIRRAGWQSESFATASAFLSHPPVLVPHCLVLDVRLPDLSGLDLQHQLAAEKCTPIIFMTGYGDVPTSVQAMKAGAAEFLEKPFRNDVLLNAIRGALAKSEAALRERLETRNLAEDYAALTRRERQIMELVVRGHMNKQIAAELGINIITVKEHRGHMMRKMKVRSLAELVQKAGRLAVAAAPKSC